MRDIVHWLDNHYGQAVEDLRALVAVPSISTDGEHAAEIDRSAELVSALMQRAGLEHVQILRQPGSYPYVYGDWLHAPDRPTLFLYAHHDVQPVNYLEQWQSDPWQLTRRDGRLYGRGAADDKGAIVAHLAAVAAFLKVRGALPINVKVLVEGEEEVGSRHLMEFFRNYRHQIQADCVVVTDTENLQSGLPSLTYSLRGIVAALVEVEALERPVHSGMGGGLLPDAALALDVILARLYWDNGRIPSAAFYKRVRRVSASEKKMFARLPRNDRRLRSEFGLLPGVRWANMKNVSPYEQTWRWPAVTVIAQEASSLRSASNQVLPKAAAIVSVRIVPDQRPAEVFAALKSLLTQDPPWGVKVRVTPYGPPVCWWMTDPQGPAFQAALQALEAGYGRKPIAIGCGGTIGFVGPLTELLGNVPALLLGIEDPLSYAHAPNESLCEDDFRKLQASLAHLFERLGALTPDEVAGRRKKRR
ncbi:MAG: dipeptidase [Gemmataceae bacterium]